jgi:hypothetical protein
VNFDCPALSFFGVSDSGVAAGDVLKKPLAEEPVPHLDLLFGP